MAYKLWNKQDKINGAKPNHFLNQVPFKNYNGDIILIYDETTNKVSQVESKEVLASVYDIDKNLKLDDFMTIYENRLEELRILREKEEKERLAREQELNK